MLGFVPQVDVLLPLLTVRETLAHAADSRLPSSWSAAQRREHVARVMELLSLSHLAETLVGEAGTSLSSGERKRVSIGAELAAAPSVLWCDEPTTGLDASSALQVVSIARELASAGGLTVVCILHQPRAEIVDLVDDLILLGSGGRTLFSGPRRLVLQYFEGHLGFLRPARTSAADYLMDCVEGRHGWHAGHRCAVPTGSAVAVPAGEEDKVDEETATPCSPGGVPSSAALVHTAELAVELGAIWRDSGEAWVAQRSDEQAPQIHIGSLAASATATAVRRGPICPALCRLPHTASHFAFLVAIYARRSCIARLRSPSLLLDLVSMLVGGAIMGIVSCADSLYEPPIPRQYAASCPPGAELLCNGPLAANFAPFLFYISICCGILATPPAVRSLGAEREVFWREAGVGANRAAYFLGKVMADTPVTALSAITFSAALFAVAPWRSPFLLFWGAIFLTMHVVGAIGRIVSAAMGPDVDSTNLLSVNLTVLLNLCSGWVAVLGDSGGWCYSHWSMRALTAIELIDGQGVSAEVYNSYVGPEWVDPNVPQAFAYLLLIGVLCDAVAFAVLLLRHRDKQR